MCQSTHGNGKLVGENIITQDKEKDKGIRPNPDLQTFKDQRTWYDITLTKERKK